ncbi:MAG: TrbI/VirB10 family protein [Pseudobdellovibrionaceae bacterium]
MTKVFDSIKSFDWKRHEDRVKELVKTKPLIVGGAVLALLFLLNLVGIGSQKESRIIERPTEINFQNGRILNDRESSFYYGKERLLSQKAQAMMDAQAQIQARMAELEKKLAAAQTASPSPAAGPGAEASPPPSSDLQAYSPTEDFQGTQVSEPPGTSTIKRTRVRGVGHGPDLIAFPVKGDTKTEGVMLPAGSYVKAKILTGVDVPEGKTYPVLMVLDFSYVAPNDHKIDLSGCFMIAKAEGNLSTERVQMQATKMSCVSRKGKMFERDVNGFIADDKDGSFAMKGKVNSKQGRVAAMAFLSGIVQGVGQAVQAAQTQQNVNPLGGSSSVMTGDSSKYMVAGGAANAAGMVAQWYLQQAQSLSPTVEVGSGRDVWIVMKDKVSLPEEFFKKERMDGNEGIYSYFTRILD